MYPVATWSATFTVTIRDQVVLGFRRNAVPFLGLQREVAFPGGRSRFEGQRAAKHGIEQHAKGPQILGGWPWMATGDGNHMESPRTLGTLGNHHIVAG